MTHDAANPSEISPLLGRPAGTFLESGDAPNGVLPNGASPNGTPSGVNKPDDDAERQEGDGDRSPQYEGMPEVKKKLKFIVPAIAIGVCCSIRHTTSSTENIPGIPFRWRSNDHRVELWQDWQRFEGSKQHIMDCHGVCASRGTPSHDKPVLTMQR